MNTILTYILLGLLFTFIVEGFSHSNLIKPKLKKQLQLGSMERIISILVWPLILITFLYHFFKELYK